jgi:hypothetical protein
LENTGWWLAFNVGVPLSIGTGVWKTFRLLGQSQPLRQAALDWLTSNNQASPIHYHFLLIRRQLWGAGVFSKRRNTFIALTFFFIFIALNFISKFGVFADSDSTTALMIALYSHGYAAIWHKYPFASIIMTCGAFILVHLAIMTFDNLMHGMRRQQASSLLYIAMLLLTLIVFTAAACALTAVAIFYLFNTGVVSGFWSYIKAVPTLVFDLRQGPNGDDGRGMSLIAALCLFGTAAICMIPILIASAVNVLHSTALGMLTSDGLLRRYYQWNQDDILKDPMKYIGAIAGITTFAISWAALAAWGLASWVAR